MKKTIIIKILSEYKVVINAGYRDGVEIGDKFNIIDPNLRILEDPDTHEILDTFTGYKSYILVEEVNEKYSICHSPIEYEASYSNVFTNNLLSNTSIFNNREKKVPLNVSEYDIDDIFNKYTDAIVSVGDEIEKEDLTS